MHARLLARRLALVLLLMSAARLVFFFWNKNSLPAAGAGELLACFAHGLRFDVSSVFWVNGPLVLLSLLPGAWREKAFFQKFLGWLWLLPNTLLLAIELADAAWFPFNLRRTIITDSRLLGAAPGQAPHLFLENWWLVLLLAGFFFLMKKTGLAREGLRPETSRRQVSGLRVQWFVFMLALPLWLLGARGGWQMRPISPIMAVQFAPSPGLAPLLTNASMNLINSAQQSFIEEKNWLTDQQLDAAFSLEQDLGHPPGSFRPLNVVTIAMEGAGSEYLERDWMHWFKTFSNISVGPKLAYANGTRSIEGNSAIVAGLPSLMADPWPFSAYQNNRITGLATVLREKGYATAFFHGSDPGSMQLDKLAAAAGFEQNFDRWAFPDQSMYDGRWGIFDRPFFQFFGQKLGEMRQPFYAHFFSLSSHDPFRVEPSFEKIFPKMDPVERSFRYADYALQEFFASFRNEKWYRNTLFVITADHTGPEKSGRFATAEGKYRVPMLFFQPGETSLYSEKKGRVQQPGFYMAPVAQQVDILPSVLDWLGYDGRFKSFGRSIFQKKESPPPTAYLFENGVFQIMDGQFLLMTDGEKPLQLFDYQQDTACRKNILMENPAAAQRLDGQLKAVIQRHHRAMVRNELY